LIELGEHLFAIPVQRGDELEVEGIRHKATEERFQFLVIVPLVAITTHPSSGKAKDAGKSV
jgi:hypothetical protein